MGSGGGSSGTSTTVQKSEPWPGQEPYLVKGYEMTEAAAGATPTTPYTGPLTTPVLQTQRDANAATLAGGQALTGLAPTVTNAAATTLNRNLGQRLAAPPQTSNLATNPQATAAIDASTRPVTEAFTRDILPAITKGATLSGAWGSGASDPLNARLRAAGQYSRDLGDAAAKVAVPLYQTERQAETSRQNTVDQGNVGLQTNENTMVPSLIQQGGSAFTQGSLLSQQAGQQQRDWNMEPVDEALMRYRMALEAPWQAVNPYMRNVAGFDPGGVGSSTTQGAGSQGGMNAGSMMAAALPMLLMGLMAFSDERLKENVEEIGEIDGLPLYRYNYIWDDKPQIGVMAQDVERVAPEAVGEVAGYKTVDYAQVVEGL